MHLDFLFSVFDENQDKEAIIWHDTVVTYKALLEATRRAMVDLAKLDLRAGEVVSLESDFTPASVAMFLALIERGCIVVPLSPVVESKFEEYREIAGVERVLKPEGPSSWTSSLIPRGAPSSILRQLKATEHPGLILFSSGSTGKSKGIVHDFLPLLEKYKTRKKPLRTITFLLFDHIGGINTMLHTLSNGGCLILVSDRAPDGICRVIESRRAEILPTTPSFINLMLLSESFRKYDLSSLTLVTYGTETMSQATLDNFHRTFPKIHLLQTYGLSEVGILRSKSKSSDSLWVKLGGDGFDIRIREGLLEIKAASSMLGYLNAESPFTEDGWFKTGDAVEVDGEYIHILGRKSDLINVGGQKVYPIEVENVLQLIPGVEEVVVSGELNALLGHIVKARVKTSAPEDLQAFRIRMREFCKDKLPPYKIPQKVEFMKTTAVTGRFKKTRSPDMTQEAI